MSSYCADTDVKAVAPDWTSISTNFEARVLPIIENASKIVDELTSQWFDARALTIQTQPCRDGQIRLFMPAPIVSITSLTESGSVLQPSQFVAYERWIEKSWTNPLPVAGWGGPGRSWRCGQLNITAVGTFGYSTPPGDIVEATAYIAAAIMGIRAEVKISPSGAQSSALLGSLPQYIRDALERRKNVGQHEQPFLISAA